MKINLENKILCADTLVGLKDVFDNSVHLIFTSPPYNLKAVRYPNSKILSYPAYLLWLKKIFTEIYRITVSGGRCIINIDAMTNRQEDKKNEYTRAIYPHLYQFMKEIGWKFYTEICWLKKQAIGRKTGWGSYCSASLPCIRRTNEYILVFSKDKWKLDSKVKSDLKKKEFELWTLSTWDIKPETRNLKKHPAPFPEELCRRIIKLFSFPGQVVLDPFCGVGTTCKMAYQLNRKYIGIDNSQEYCDYAENRIEEEKQKKTIEKQISEKDIEKYEIRKKMKKKEPIEKGIFLKYGR